MIDGAKPEPVTPQWTKDDKKARATMGLCIADNQYSVIKTAQPSCEFWDNLQRHHEKVTVTSRVSLMLKKLCNLNLREGGDLEARLLDLDDLFEQLETVGQHLTNQLKIPRSLSDRLTPTVALEQRLKVDQART